MSGSGTWDDPDPDVRDDPDPDERIGARGDDPDPDVRDGPDRMSGSGRVGRPGSEGRRRIHTIEEEEALDDDQGCGALPRYHRRRA